MHRTPPMSTRKMRHSDVSLEDMMDVSDACVLEELNEMATVADEQTHSSPPEIAPQTMSLPSMGPPPVPSARNSRSNSQTSQQSAEEQIRIVVHRDEEKRQDVKKNVPEDRNMRDTLAGVERKAKSDKNITRRRRSKSDTTVSHENLSNPPGSWNPNELEASAEVAKPSGQLLSDIGQPSTDSPIVQQLQDISEERAALMQLLLSLAVKEKELLRTLKETETSQVPASSTNHDENAVPDPRPLVPQPSIPAYPPSLSKSPVVVETPIRQPRKQSTDTSKAKTRPVSAPPQSTPTGLKQRTPSTSRRIPLADKTEESLATFDSTPILKMSSGFPEGWSTQGAATMVLEERTATMILEENTATMMSEASTTTVVLEESVAPTKNGISHISERIATPEVKSKIPLRGKAIRVPIKFDEHDGEDTRVNKNHGAHRTDIPRGRSTKTEKAGETGLRSVTPESSKAYNVPPTIKRKKWDF